MNLERALADAPDPVLARTAWERVCEPPTAREILERPIVAPVAIQVLGFSPAAADFLVKYPEEAGSVRDGGPAQRGSTSTSRSPSDVERLGPAAGLRRFRRRAMLRVAARDLAGAALDEVVHEITDVADACWSAAVPADARRRARSAVIALGKWGGRELNYSSDVDLLFVHERSTPADNEAAERAAGALLQLLSEPTADGVALRVDTALRPGGRAGALVSFARRDARLLRARLRHLGAPGDDQGARRRRRLDRSATRSSPAWRRSCTPSTSSRPRSTTSGARRCASRSTSVSAARS